MASSSKLAASGASGQAADPCIVGDDVNKIDKESDGGGVADASKLAASGASGQATDPHIIGDDANKVDKESDHDGAEHAPALAPAGVSGQATNPHVIDDDPSRETEPGNAANPHIVDDDADNADWESDNGSADGSDEEEGSDSGSGDSYYSYYSGESDGDDEGDSDEEDDDEEDSDEENKEEKRPPFQSVMDFDHDSDDLRPDDERSQISDTTPPGSDDSPSDSDNSDDPVVREVEFLINEVPELKHLLVFQWAGIEKGQPLPKVSEVRVKWESGFVEVDVPIPRETLMSDQYDRVAAIKYGEALRKTKELGQTAYGAAAGFERKLPPPTKRKGAANDEDLDDDDDDDDDAGEEASTSAAAPVEEDDNIDKYLANYEDAIDKGHVLQTTTWEGRLRERGEGGGFTMVGVLRDNLLHFNMVHAYVQLHPSMQHLDALNHLELNKKEEIVEAEPQQDGDEDEEDYDAIPVDEEWVEAVFDGPANEPWERYPWVPEESEAAYASFESRMFLANEKQTLLQFETVKSYSQRMLPRVIPRGRPVQEESVSESESETEEEVEFPERWEKTEGKGKGKAVEVEEEEVVEEEEQVVPAPAESVS